LGGRVVAAKFDDDDFGVKEQDALDIGDGILGSGAACALIDDLVMVAVTVKLLLEKVRIGLAGLQAVAGGDAVPVADQDGPIGGPRATIEELAGQKKQPN